MAVHCPLRSSFFIRKQDFLQNPSSNLALIGSYGHLYLQENLKSEHMTKENETVLIGLDNLRLIGGGMGTGV